ncbi:PKD domain-containing protein [Flavilitoribacter nigricans]|uniref:PKD domain-containing protein n=1 Tax=Flavilitoribacter nigricans (strain ATCC 23147 / DSM 23189 / NBRC 102662 / NCIMB 1420 / SS-2) TaxID=1122177 RepID=A0A2D0N7B8_FLAN2|nr:PKD domain-containing protein [Flavilitoribacter nigricans]PHN04414.1 hypothetical protein CRP01_20610 [Flavilitoribacter nigricans DSM 23189 = NBRC 102662]
MKYFPLLLFLLPLGLGAQITLTQENVPAPGDTLFYARDTTATNLNIGMAGPDQTWDFSQLQADEYFQLIASDTVMDPDVENYPGANLIITSEQVKTFIQSNDTAVYILGGGVPEAAAFGLEVVQFQPPQKLYDFPTTYGTAFTNFYSVDATVDGSLVLPGVDSIRLIRRATATVEVDGYGTVKTPYNNYEALRQRIETINADSIYAQVFGSWIPFLADTSVTVQYQWISAESKGSTVSINLDVVTGEIENVEFFLDVDNASAPAAAFTYEDQGEGVFVFTDQSANAPAGWEWTFGDGGTSDAQNPEYTFTADGEYQVCLTVSNIIGSDQICQTITVDLLDAVPDPRHEIRLSVQPNPARQNVRIIPEGFELADFSFQLFNSQGQQILQRRFNGQLQLDVSDLPAGLYAYFLKTVEGKVEKWSSGKIQVAR